MIRNPVQQDKMSYTDEELVSKIVKKNDTHLFSILYDRYADKIYGKCLSFTKSVEEAQDMTHDIFIQLFVKLRTFKGDSKFSTWLYSFTYNYCVNHIQRQIKKKNNKFTELKEETHIVDDTISDVEIFNLKVENLMKTLDIIDPNDKMIILMKYQDDFSIQDIQNALNIGESAVKMRLKRAKEKLIEVYQTLE